MQVYIEYLQKVTSIINRSRLPIKEEKALNQLVEKIGVRVRDSNCYLAVIGEFSSGKSTLINAFLKDGLLPTSALVTTATATRLRHGDSLELKAFFHNPYILPIKPPVQSPIVSKQKNWLQKLWFGFCRILKRFLGFSSPTTTIRYEPKFQRKEVVTTQDLEFAGIEIRSFIEKLASDEDVAQHLDYIEIEHPSNFLQDGVVIIDLPGINAPNERHFQLTRSVVEHEADAAIIIIPAIQPLTQSLLQFIKENVTEYIDRCVFIITKLDQIREKERDLVVKSVATRLQKEFKVKNNSIYGCSPQLALDYHTGEVMPGENYDFWSEQFQAMETALIKRLRIEREKAIAGSIARIFEQLLHQLDTNLNSLWDEYQLKKSALEAELMTDFQAFIKQQSQIYQNQIANTIMRTKQRVPDWVGSQTMYIYDKVKNAILYASSWDELKDILENRLVGLLNNGKDEIANRIKEQCNPIQEEAHRIGEEFDHSFEQAYRRLNILGGTVSVNSFSDTGKIKINTYSVLASAKEMNQSNFGNSMKGFFSNLFKGLLEERRRQVWNLIRPNLEREFEEIESLTEQAIIDYGEQAKQAINARMSYYLSVYQNQINILIQKQKTELLELQNFQQQAQADLLQIKQLQAKINTVK
jgi:GTPase SAR1 family protein